tara:strand:+ start:112349 stop:113425 length:1077 start_codon:yes stop_codon:yes gene_type:complete
MTNFFQPEHTHTPLRGVVVGAGYFSRFHLNAWSRIDDVDLVAVCDLDQSKATETAQQYGIDRVYSDISLMLAEVKPDFIDIVTRPDSHLELVRAAAAVNVHVICQKPLAPNIDEARQLVQCAQDAGIELMVHENFRFQPWYREIRKLLQSDIIGDRLHTISVRTRTGDGWQSDAYQARQPYFVTMPQFLVFETGVHFIDTFRYLAGEIDGVYASLRKMNPNIAGEDTGIVLFEFSNGARGLWDASRFNESNADDPRFTFGECLVETNGGSIRLYADGRITLQPLGQQEQEHAYDHAPRDFAGDCVFATQQHFVDSLRHATPFETSGTEYLKTLRVQEAVYESASKGTPVRGLAEGGHR